jgi:hypothetical protein
MFLYVITNCALCFIKFRLQFATIGTTDVKTMLSSLYKIKTGKFRFVAQDLSDQTPTVLSEQYRIFIQTFQISIYYLN